MLSPRSWKMDDFTCFVSRTWQVSWPMTLIMFFEFMISLTDVYVAGKISKEVQAAYGVVIQIYFICVVVANGLTVGTVSVVSRSFTAQRTGAGSNDLSGAVFSSFVSAGIAGLGICLTGMLVLPSIIGWLNIPHDLKGFVLPLSRIYLIGIFFHYVLINGNGILRSCGMVKNSLKTMAVVCACNLLLIFIFVFHTDLGYRGIAVSTAAGVTIGSLLNMRHLRALMGSLPRFSGQVVRRIVGIGWPMGLLQVLWQLGSIALFLILSMLPENVELLAAFTAGLRIESAIFLPAFAFNMANAVIVGNLLGERKEAEAYRAGLVTAGVGVAVVTVLTLFVILNARWIAGSLSDNPAVVRESIRYIYISMISEPFMAWGIILGGGLGGAGDTRNVMMRVAGSVWLVRIPLCYVSVAVFGWSASAVWWAMNVSQLIQSMLLTKRYLGKAWLRSAPPPGPPRDDGSTLSAQRPDHPAIP